MNAYDFMKQIKTIDLRIKIVAEEIQELQALLGASSIVYDKLTSNMPNGTDKTFELICKLMDKETQLLQEYITLTDTKQAVKKVLYQLDSDLLVDMLYKRYFEFKKWRDIADELHYTNDYVKHLHAAAIKMIDSILNNTK